MDAAARFRRLGDVGTAVRGAVASAVLPASLAAAAAAQLDEERSAISLAAIAGLALPEAEAEARRRYAACTPSMTMAGARRSVTRDLAHGDWQP